jgi:hypothetical protein
MYIKKITPMTKIEKFLELQREITLQIEVYGCAHPRDTATLEAFANTMTPEELDEACQIWAAEIF